MKNFKKTASVIAGLMLVASSASAANLTVSCDSNDKLTVKGTEFTNGTVSITVAHSSEGDSYTNTTKFVAVKEIIPNYKGDISFSAYIPSDAISGNYVVTAYDKSGETKQTFFFLNKESAKEAFSKLDSSKTVAETANIINEYSQELGVSEDLADEALDIEKTAKLFNNFKPAKGLDVDSFNKTWLSAKLSGGRVYTSDEFISTVDANAEILGCEKIPYMSLSADDKKAVYEAYIASDISSGDFTENLNTIAFLSTINKSDITRKQFEECIFEDYKDYLDLNLKDYNKLKSPDEVISALMKKTYDSFEDFETAFNKAVAAQKSKENDKSSGGGGGGGTGKVSASGTFDAVTEPVVQVPEPENTPADIPDDIFDDIDNHWSKAAVMFLKDKGIASGVGNNLYAPENQVTRAEFAKIIAQSFFADNEVGDVQFADVDDNAWYAPFVKKLASLGIINGRGDGTFDPSSPITRQDAALIMNRAALLAGVSLEPRRDGATFEDEIADYAKDAVDTLYKANLINGISDKEFAPYSNVTRAQAAQLVYNMMK